MSGAVLLWSVALCRRRPWALLMLVLVIGLGAGLSLTAAGGARRAASGWERFRAATLAPDAVISLPGDAPAGTLDRVEELPAVEAVAPFTFLPIAPVGLRPDVDVTSLVALDERFGSTVYRPRILDGRRPVAGRADEVTINQALVDRHGLRIGQRVPLVVGADPTELSELGPVTIVGVHAGTFDIGPQAGRGTLIVPAEFLRAHQADLGSGPPAALARLRGGNAAIPLFTEQVTRLAGNDTFVTSGHEDGAAVVDALRVQAVSLWLLAAVAGIASLVAGSQALGRVIGDAATDHGVLTALGLSPRSRRALGLVPGLATGGGAALVAGIVAMAASPRLPTGLARRVEPSPGFFVDPLTLTLGGALLVAALAAAALRSSWGPTAGRIADAPPPGWSRPGSAPVTLGIGAGWVLAPGRRHAAATRSAVAAVAAGLTGVVAVTTFTASLHHTLADERLYGWAFDGALVTRDGSRDGFDEIVAGLLGDPVVTGLAHGNLVRLSIGGRTIEALAVDPLRGQAHPSLLAGRIPVGDDEVVLGADDLKQLGSKVGDTVPAEEEGRRSALRIVGLAAFPELGDDSDVASGGLVTRAAADALGLEPSGPVALVRVAAGRDAGEVLSRHAVSPVEPILPFEPARLSNMREVGAVPTLLGGFLTLLAAAAAAHSLALTVRSRRRDIGILRALGLVRVQACGLVGAQAAVTVAAGLLVGVPAGLVVGRWGWTLIARGLGVVERPVVAWAATLATVAGALLIIALVAALPARAAVRLRPAHVLRSE